MAVCFAAFAVCVFLLFELGARFVVVDKTSDARARSFVLCFFYRYLSRNDQIAIAEIADESRRLETAELTRYDFARSRSINRQLVATRANRQNIEMQIFALLLFVCTLKWGCFVVAAASPAYNETLADQLSLFASAAYAADATKCMPTLRLEPRDDWQIYRHVTIKCSFLPGNLYGKHCEAQNFDDRRLRFFRCRFVVFRSEPLKKIVFAFRGTVNAGEREWRRN